MENGAGFESLAGRGKASGTRRMARNAWPGVKAICFDLDGTLYRTSQLRLGLLKLVIAEYLSGRLKGRELRALRAYRRLREQTRSAPRPGIDAYTIEMAAKHCGLTAEEVGRTVEHWMFHAPLPVLAKLRDPELRQMMERLRLRGYRLAIYSDYPVKSKLEALGLPQQLFDALAESGEPAVDSLKPHPKGFLEAARRLGLKPSEVLFIGDRDSVDGAGARAAGMPFALLDTSLLPGRKRGRIRNLRELEAMLGTSETASAAAPREGCWICGSRENHEFLAERLPAEMTPDIAKISDTHFGCTARLLQCTACGFIYADLESARAIEKLYANMTDPTYGELAEVRKHSHRKLLQRIQEVKPEAGTLLDVGAAMGEFCVEAERLGFRVEGIEPSAWAVAEAHRRFGVSLRRGYFPHRDLEGKQFDVITMRDVVEHVSIPIEFLAAARRCLAPNSLLVLITPDVGSWAPKILARRWWHFRPAHIGYFTQQTLAAALGRAGLTLESREPYSRWLPLGYVLARAVANLPGGKRLRGLVQFLEGIRWPQLPMTLRDDFVYFARPVNGDMK